MRAAQNNIHTTAFGEMICSCLFITFIYLFPFSLQSQNTWTTTGIRDSVIAVSGAQGIIVAATQNNGVAIFNTVSGVTQIFNIASGDMSTNDFRAVSCINEKIYAGSLDDGMYLHENDNWQHFTVQNSPLPGNSVTDFAFDSLNDIVYVATDGGLASIHNNAWTIYDSINSPLPGNTLTCLLLDDANRLWIGTRYTGMAKMEDGGWEIYNFLNSGINDNYIKAITEDTHGFLYVADYFGINKYEIASDNWLFVYNMFTSPISSDRINRMGFDDEGTFWIATHNGVNEVDTANQWTAFFAENSDLPHNTTDGLFIDENNWVWAGTYGGLAFYASSSDKSDFPPAIAVDPNPCSNEIVVSTFTPMQISIYTLSGTAVLRGFQTVDGYGECKTVIPVSALSPGIYLISATGDQQTLVKRFIKM